MEVIKSADYIIDMGPEGGEKGGYVIAEGSPEELIQNPASYTGQFLRKKLHNFIHWLVPWRQNFGELSWTRRSFEGMVENPCSELIPAWSR